MKLTVYDFSCIKHAELEIRPLTILVGPQASGKSVLSRLIYYFNDVLSEMLVGLQDYSEPAEFKNALKSKFKKWFPVEAWGAEKFLIEFKSGEFHMRIARTEYLGSVNDNVRIWLSSFIEKSYINSYQQINELIRKTENKDRLQSHMDVLWKADNTIRSKFAKELGNEFVQEQLFVPAGRSFFTSIGKAIAAFEQSSSIDPLAIRFGRYVALIREHYQLIGNRGEKKFDAKDMEAIFGGKIVIERKNEYVKASDGRKIPFPFLSSGQQELLPLWLALDSLGGREQSRQMVFIEEPEAHLFPYAQGVLVEQLAKMLNSPKGVGRLFITTHSPYVLSKFNNLIKASQVASSSKGDISRSVAKIVPKQAWLSKNVVAAYAMIDGELCSIIDDESLIDGSYLDNISGLLAREYSSLIGLELL